MKLKAFLTYFVLLALAACSQVEPGTLESTAQNLVKNGSFDGAGDWSFYAESPVTGQFIVEDGAGKLNIQGGDGADWKAQLYQDVAVQSGQTYTLSFEARATAQRPLRVAIRNSQSFTDSWSETLDLSASTKTFSYSFTASASDDQQLIFYAGQSGKDVFIDDVRLSVGGSGDDSGDGDDGGSSSPGNGGDNGGEPSGAKIAPSQGEANQLNSDIYDEWKSNVEFDGPIPMRIGQFENGIVSEAVGYGMLLAVYNNDKATFNRFWNFAKGNLVNYEGDVNKEGGLLPWIFDSNGNVKSSGNATDGDLDIAFALLVADNKGWGTGADARKHIDNILKYNVADNNALQEGYWTSNDENTINSSYLSPGYFKAFADYTGDSRWLKVRDKSYEILEKGFDKGYEVIPHDIQVSGTLASSYPNHDSDAARGPWRLAIDYLWYGDSRAKALLQKYNNFYESEGLSNLCDVYDVNGNAEGGWCGSQAGWIMGSAACAQLADGNSKSEAWRALTNAYDGGYYSRELKMLAMLNCSGYMSNPAK